MKLRGIQRQSANNFRFINPRTGDPLSAGLVWIWTLNTLIQAEVFSDPEGVIPATFPVCLNSHGEASIYVVEPVRVTVTDRERIVIETWECK